MTLPLSRQSPDRSAPLCLGHLKSKGALAGLDLLLISRYLYNDRYLYNGL
jgi:hypothetical protein